MSQTDSERVPTLSRRRELGSGSANSLLLTVLGEFVLPDGRPVWTSALIALFRDLGVEEKAVRQALMRTSDDGWITADRLGRRTRWRLSGAGERLLTEGSRRIYSFRGPPEDWDARWLLLLVNIPENSRALRAKLRTQLGWAGFGLLPQGVWIRPRVDDQDEVRQVLASLNMADAAHSFVANSGQLGTDRHLVRQAWDLDAIEQRYEDFLDQVAPIRPRTDLQALLSQIRLVQEWRRFPLLDPGLPRELLPRTWSGARAADLFVQRHAAWAPRARAAWDQLTADG
jgi:phenylacetic acid degradation operon negative regulatory protein